MFSILNSTNTEKLSVKDHLYFISNLQTLREDPELSFLKSLDIENITIYWCKTLTLERGILGFYNIFTPTSIYILQYSHCKNFLVSTCVHELYHMYQHKKYGTFLYSILNIPFIREFTLEKGARKKEVYCDSVFVSYTD